MALISTLNWDCDSEFPNPCLIVRTSRNASGSPASARLHHPLQPDSHRNVRGHSVLGPNQKNDCFGLHIRPCLPSGLQPIKMQSIVVVDFQLCGIQRWPKTVVFFHSLQECTFEGHGGVLMSHNKLRLMRLFSGQSQQFPKILVASQINWFQGSNEKGEQKDKPATL